MYCTREGVMKFKSEVFLVFLMSAFVIVLFGCGSSGGGDGGGKKCAAPICNATTGIWSVDETVTQNGCDPSDTGYQGTYDYSVTQDGKRVTIVDSKGGIYNATFCGDTVRGSATYGYNGGTIKSNITLTIAPACTTFTGASHWTWTYNALKCSGITALDGSKN
jgi:hypothetical protein